MPIYEYKCLDCEKKFEIIQKSSDNNMQVCPDCGGKSKKLISNTSFILKGTGWYVTDYASPERKKAIEAEKGGNGEKPAAADKTDNKNSCKAETASGTESKIA